MDTPYADLPKGRIAYIRRVDPGTLPHQMRAMIPEDAQIWGVHTEAGECLALTDTRRAAFLLARENDLAPVSAH